ncbi:MAG: hypothetical protein CVU05_02725 [Bacteroidetes bacterium HGW-Bacteroidetes-21]|jgi:hypothetical protein|nr:MAG: hypothetical protein CVU05_02725 [Bacteroidetes bacterium HGW-Bacteroidetes-21]
MEMDEIIKPILIKQMIYMFGLLPSISNEKHRKIILFHTAINDFIQLRQVCINESKDLLFKAVETLVSNQSIFKLTLNKLKYEN